MILIPQGATERLRFEPLCHSHASRLRDSLLDPAVYEFISGRPPKSMLELAERFERLSKGPPANREKERWWNIAVFASDGRGLGRLEATILGDRAELAYLFGSKHWGNGYAQEAVRWLQDKLAEDGVASTLWATVMPTNERSVRLLMQLGYTQVMDGWPHLTSYDEGDLVFHRPCQI